MQRFMHFGCGLKRKNQTTKGFDTNEWQEIRVDIDPSVEPDIIASGEDLSVIPANSINAVFTSHSIEHLYYHDAIKTIEEFQRILKADGYLILTCPDMEAVCSMVVQGNLMETAYVSGEGPIAPIDIIYGFRPALAQGKTYMAHKCGFTAKSMARLLSDTNFKTVATMRRPSLLEFWAIATKTAITEVEMRRLAEQHLPK